MVRSRDVDVIDGLRATVAGEVAESWLARFGPGDDDKAGGKDKALWDNECDPVEAAERLEMALLDIPTGDKPVSIAAPRRAGVVVFGALGIAIPV